MAAVARPLRAAPRPTPPSGATGQWIEVSIPGSRWAGSLCGASPALTTAALALVWASADRRFRLRRRAAARNVDVAPPRKKSVGAKAGDGKGKGKGKGKLPKEAPVPEPEILRVVSLEEKPLSSKERFEQRRKLWGQLHQQGELAKEKGLESRVDAEFDVENGGRSEDLNKIEVSLRDLAEAGETQQLASRLDRLWNEPWQFGVECLVGVGANRLALDALREAHDRELDNRFWHGAFLSLAESILKIDDDSNEVLDRNLAEELVILSLDADRKISTFELLTQLAVVEAQRAANLIQRRRVMRKARGQPDEQEDQNDLDAESEEVERKLALDIEFLFDSSLKRVRSISDFVEGFLAGERLERVDQWMKLASVTRWNQLLRLVAKMRDMPSIFQVLDVMQKAGVYQTVETYEFVARAAVATVKLSALVDSFQTMPPPSFPEIVFLGWSNVGKSSLVNSLLHRKALAPVSVMPGKTTQFHFYALNEERALFPRMTLVDVPGLGAAMTEHAQMDHWKRTLLKYLKQRGPMLRTVFHLISCEVLLLKGGPSSLDTEILRMASRLQPDYTIVLTKVDLLEQQSDVRRVVQLISELISKYRLKAQIIPSSVKSCRGRDILWKRLWKAVDPDEAWRWQTAPNDLAEAKQRMDEMAEAGDWEQLVESVDWAKKKRLSDFWEYGVRCMVRMGKLREAWQWVKQADDSWEEESSASPDLVPEDEDEQYAEEEQYAADKETEAAFEDAKKEKERERNKRRRDRELFLEQREAEGEEEDEKEKQRQDKMMDELLLGLEQVVVETSEAAGEEQEGERQELELEMENEEEEEEEEILEYKDSAGDEDNDGSDDVDHVMRPKQAARGKSSRGAAFVRDRAALVVGFAALAPALSKAGEGVNEMEVPVDLELAQEVLDVLSTEHISRSSAVELMLEWCVADARQGARALALSSAPTPSSSSSAPAPRAAEPPEAKLAYDQMFVRLNHFVSSVKAWNSPPWSADRWNQLIRWTGKRRELQSVELVLDAMKACRVKGSEHTDATMRDLAVACVHLVCEAETCSKLDGRLRSAARLPEVVVLGSVGMDVRSGVSSLVDSMLTATPRRRPEDEIESLSGLGTEGQRGGRVRSGSRNSRRGKTTKPEQQDDVKLAKLISVNVTAEGMASEAAAMPPVAIIDIPAVRRPSVASLGKDSDSGVQKEAAADAGIWAATPQVEQQASSDAFAWQRDVCDLLSASGLDTPLAGVFQVVDCRDFVAAVKREVPSYDPQRTMQELLEQARPSDEIFLQPDDLEVQQAALRAGPEHYVLVVADSSMLGLEQRKNRISHMFYAHTDIILKRREILAESLRRQVETAAASVSGGRVPKVSVILADKEHFCSTTEFWRLLWACAEAGHRDLESEDG